MTQRIQINNRRRFTRVFVENIGELGGR